MGKGNVIMAMSGGVDSSVAAALLKQEGYEVTGVIMEIYDESVAPNSIEKTRHACFGPGEAEDIEDARKVAEELDIPLHIINLKDSYRNNIINFFIKEYREGKTPNPCVKCNYEMKFCAIPGELKRQGIDFDYFATGHYARIEYMAKHGQYFLKKAVDSKKDQTYFLYRLTHAQLESILFPLGHLTKPEVKELARELLPAMAIDRKPESQDFIAGGYHQLFKNEKNHGLILNSSGKVIGEHHGLEYYTIGQRKGIGLSSDEPLYVIEKDAKRNAIIVGEKDDMMGTEFIARELNWINFEQLAQPLDFQCKIRFQEKVADSLVIPIENDESRVRVKFSEPQRAITPGQAAVFYDNDIVVGGGIIEREVKKNEL